MDALVEDFAEVLNKVGQLQKVRELDIDIQCLQQEHDVFNVKNFRLSECVASSGGLLFGIWRSCFACVT